MTVVKTVQINVEADQANKELETFNENIKETDKSTEGLTNQLDAMTGGALSGFKKLTGGIRTAIKGFKSLKVAIAATGLGLLVIAIGSIAAAFKNSEEGQNKFTKFLNQVKVITGNVIDIFATLGNSILSIGKALGKLATGDIKGAKEAFSEFKEGIKETGEGIKNFGEETRRELKLVREVSDALAEADKRARDLLIERAEAERDVAQLREKVARKDLYTAEERKQALIEANNITDDIINKEIELQKVRLESIRINNSLSGSTKEDLQEEAEAQAELIRLETERAIKRKELGAELSAINEAELAYKRALVEEEKKLREEQIKTAEDEINAELELEQKRNEEQLRLDNERYLKELQQAEEAALKKRQIEEETENAKIALAGNTLGLIEQFAKEGSNVAKSAAVAQTLISTFQGVQSALAAPSIIPEPLGTALKFANAALVGASGALNVKKILSTDIGKGGGTASTGQPRGSNAPSFNLVQGTGTSQIVEGLKKENAPVKSYVVSSDVSTAQELDRKIVEGASL